MFLTLFISACHFPVDYMPDYFSSFTSALHSFSSFVPSISQPSGVEDTGDLHPCTWGLEEHSMVSKCPFFCPVLPMSLLSHRPWAGPAAEWPEHPTEAVSTSTQWPTLARTPSRCPAHGHSCARALGAAACPGAAVSGPAAATEAEPYQSHPETARPRPRGDPAGARVQVLLAVKTGRHQRRGWGWGGVGAWLTCLMGQCPNSTGHQEHWREMGEDSSSDFRTLVENVCRPLGGSLSHKSRTNCDFSLIQSETFFGPIHLLGTGNSVIKSPVQSFLISGWIISGLNHVIARPWLSVCSGIADDWDNQVEYIVWVHPQGTKKRTV